MNNQLNFYKMMDSLGDGVICVNERNKIEYMNHSAKSIIIEKDKNCVGLRIEQCFNVCTLEDGSVILDIIEDVRVNNITRGLLKDAYIFTNDCNKVFISASLSSVEMHGKKYIIVNFREITKIKQLELENLEQKMNLETFFNSLPIGVVIVNKDRKIIRVNPFIARKFRMSNDEEEKFLGNLLKCKHAASESCGTSEACANCILKRNVENVVNHTNGCNTEKIELEHMIKGRMERRNYEIGFVHLEQNKEKQVMLMIQDITEQTMYENKIKIAKEDAERANQLKSQFLSNMSHEIRTPLNGIIGMIDLSKRMVEDPEVMDYLITAKTSSLNLLQIINSVLDISKIEAGKFVVLKSAFSMKKLLNEVYAENLGKIKNEDVRFILKPYEYAQEIFVSDGLRIKQVLGNLVDNAIKFTDYGSVHITHKLVKNEENYKFRIEVRDTGIGMEQSYLSNLYENFSQEDGTYTRQKGGTGLGLAISKAIVGKLDGTISCSSAIGVGTVFTVDFPMECEKKKTGVSASPPLTEVEKTENDKVILGKILYAEDDVVNQKIVQKQLELLGHQVDIAVNGKEAVEMFSKRGHYDLILMDIQMPEMSGIEATDLIRQTKEGKDVPIIALTALALKNDKHMILQHEFDEYITKPVVLDDLSKIVNDYIMKNKKNKELEDCKDANDYAAIMLEIREKVKEIIKIYHEEDRKNLVEMLESLSDRIDDNGIEQIKYNVLKLKLNARKENFENFDEMLGSLEEKIEKMVE